MATTTERIADIILGHVMAQLEDLADEQYSDIVSLAPTSPAEVDMLLCAEALQQRLMKVVIEAAGTWAANEHPQQWWSVDLDEAPGCDRHGSANCSDPDCIRTAGGSVLASELRDAERWSR